MSAAAWTGRLAPSSAAEAALKAAAGLWLLVAVLGQWAFVYYLAAFYGPSIARGDFKAWNRNTFLIKGYVPGDTAGNLAFAAHALLAAVIAFGGAVQLIPQIRTRALFIHRWNGRLFLLTAFGASASGLYMEWARGARINLGGAVAVSLNAALIILFGGLAWRSALKREVSAHGRWALRTYLVANGVWFTRVGFMAWILVSRTLFGSGDRYDGGFFLLWSFGCYLLPLAVLELYSRARESAGPGGRFAVAGGLVVLTLLMGVGIFGVATHMWWPLLGAPK